jgi:hypothetical protein
VGPRASLDAMEKRKILPLPEIEPQPSSPYPVAVLSIISRPSLYISFVIGCSPSRQVIIRIMKSKRMR